MVHKNLRMFFRAASVLPMVWAFDPLLNVYAIR
jgi:hypothetical protein